MPLTAAAVARIVSGRLQGSADAVCSGFWTDSRSLRPGEGFIALASRSGDGHAYVADVLRGGCPIVVVSRPLDGERLGDGKAAIVVGDTWEALALLAAAVRSSLPLTVAAITGTNGKTGVKELTARLTDPASSCRSERNYNNLLGVAWSLLRLPAGCRTLVAEIGMNHRGEIDRLASILAPSVGVITAIRPVHLEHLGSLREVAEAKAELIPHLPAHGTLVANGDDPRVRSLVGRAACRVVLCGTGAGCDLTASGLTREGGGCWSFTVAPGGMRLTAPLPGRFWVVNALLALGAARALGVDDADIIRRWPASLPLEHRMGVTTLPGGALLIDDSYNASPASVREAVTLLADLPLDRRFALLGEMAELGPRSQEIHRRLGTYLARRTPVTVLGVGPMGGLMAGAAAAEAAGRGRAFASIEEAVAFLRGADAPGTGILVKGSRVAGMERAVAGLIGAAVAGGGH